MGWETDNLGLILIFFSNILTREVYSVLRVGGIKIGVKGIVLILVNVNMFQLLIL